ncbi:PadR family transcriptional regulator [Amnibacterium endophyticum]|uniref:PadR family transcriptional regulator n=1 Tax=Amnibacterium endophyticum TaxID=2109337 RepID=A0ABW4LJB2_9MICO
MLRELEAAAEALWGLRLVALTGRPAGSVYPILARLEEGGWVASRWEDSADRGPRRRFYELTPEGRASVVPLLMKERPHGAASGLPVPLGRAVGLS